MDLMDRILFAVETIIGLATIVTLLWIGIAPFHMEGAIDVLTALIP